MTVPVRFHRLAGPEFVRASARYGLVSASLEARFVAAMSDAITRISINPLCGAVSNAPYRWVKLRKFPYVLHHEFTASQVALVYAIAHGRRRPGYWKRRPTAP